MLAGMAAGTIPEVCAFCGQGPKPGPEWSWEAGHRVPPARQGGPEVRPAHRRCNRQAGARLKHQLLLERVERRAAERIEATRRYLGSSA